MPKDSMCGEIVDTLKPYLHETTVTRIALAVSGGGDSMAMLCFMVKAMTAELKSRIELICLTVDHGFRPEAAEEAALVARVCAEYAIPHQTLTWCGDKPSTGIQAAARQARYALLGQACADAFDGRGADILLTAHTMEDQAETVFARLARGAGPEGLKAMRLVQKIATEAGPVVSLIRPMLSMRRAELRDYLMTQQIPFVDEPSNEDPSYERVKTRAVLAALQAQELLSVEALARSATQIQQVVKAVVELEPEFKQARGCFGEDGIVRFECDAFSKLSLKDRAILLRQAIFAVSGAMQPPQWQQTQAALHKITTAKMASLKGALIHNHKNTMTILREPAAVLGRKDQSAQPMEQGARSGQSVWDHRMIVEIPTLTEPSVLIPVGKILPETTLDSKILASLPALVTQKADDFRPLTVVAVPAVVKNSPLSADMPWKGQVDTLNVSQLTDERFWQRVLRFETPN